MLRGTLGTIVDLVALWILVRFLGVHPLPAFVLSGVIAVGEMFFLRRKRWGADTDAHPLHFALLYLVIGLLSITLSCIAFYLGAAYLWAKVIGIALTSPVSYLLSKRLFDE